MSKQILVNELHKPVRRNFVRRKFRQIGILDTYQLDLIDIQGYADENDGNKYILVAIDVFTKFCYAIPLKSKTAQNTANGMNAIFLKHHKYPNNCLTDEGMEFNGRPFKKLMTDHDIHLYTTYSGLKASICERMIRTLKTNLWKLFSFNGNHKYIDILDDVVEKYNNTKHRTIKMKPIDVDYSNEKHLLDTVYNYKYNNKEKQRFFVNDHVRISKYKALFTKGYLSNWTYEIFQILSVQKTVPITYLLKDYEGQRISGGFYQFELQKVANPDVYLVKKIIKRKKNKILVEFLGFIKPEWINKADLDA